MLARLPPDNAAALTEPIVPRWSANLKQSGYFRDARQVLLVVGRMHSPLRDLCQLSILPFNFYYSHQVMDCILFLRLPAI